MAHGDGVIELLVQGVERVTLLKAEQTEPFLKAQVHPLPLPEDTRPEVEALHRAVARTGRPRARACAAASPGQHPAAVGPGPGSAAPRLPVGSMLSLDVAKEQALLEAPTRLEALRLCTAT